MRVNERCAGSQCGVDRHQRWQFLPRDWKTRGIERFDCVRSGGNRGDGFATKARFDFRKHRLIGAIRNHAETVFAGNILCGEDGVNAGMRRDDRIEIAERNRAR